MYVYRRQILRRVKMGIHELHHKRGEQLYRYCENPTRGRFLPFANISHHRVSSSVGKQEIIFVLYPVYIYISRFNISLSYNASFYLRRILTFDNNDTKLSSLITQLIAINMQRLFTWHYGVYNVSLWASYFYSRSCVVSLRLSDINYRWLIACKHSKADLLSAT